MLLKNSLISMSPLILIPLLLVAFGPQTTESVAVISIDLGSEFMKIGIVKPGVPMEIVLNKESKRKTPLVVSLRGTEREFSSLALAQAIKNPKTAYFSLTQLLAKSIDSPAVKAYREKYPFYDIKEDPVTRTIYFQHDQTTTYTPEDLLAMIMDHARELATDYGEQSIDAAVISVPAYFSQAERKAVLYAAELVNLKVLQLVNANTAAGLNYGVFRRKDFNSTGTTFMFFDMGAAGTTATVATYNVVKHKEDYEANPQLVVRGVGFDRTLGGDAFTMRLAKHLAKAFYERTKKDVFTNPKATVKIYKEADRVKSVLSANADHTAQIEGLMDDVDFKLAVTRKEFEEMCADLFDRIGAVVNDAFLLSEMIPEEVSAVVLVGGGTRIPKVQENLLKATQKTELAKNLNTDEAPALGAVYQAAFASKGYKVLKFYIKDINLYPIVVDFQKHSEPDSSEPTEKSYIRRTLFDKTNQFPQKKVMTFNKHTVDFDFNINYGDLSYLSQESIERLGIMNISQVNVTGVKSVFEKHANKESKGIKVHFKIDDNGILNLEKIDIAFEKDGAAEEEESTLSKLGSKISSFFGGEEKTTTEEDKEKVEDTKEAGEKSEKTADETKESVNMTSSSLNATNNATLAKNVTTILREDISYVKINLDYIDRTEDLVKDSKKKLGFIKEKEREAKEKAKAVNNLEAFLFDTKDKLSQDEYLAFLTEAEREALTKKASEVTDWLDEADFNTETKEYNDQLKSMKKLCRDVTFRIEEKKNRPKRLEELKLVFNKSVDFLDTIKNLTGGENKPLTQVQYDTLEKLVKTTMEWEEKMLAEQALLKDNETPKLLSADITDKAEALRREVGYLVTKIKYFRPPTKKTPLKDDKKTKNKTEEATTPENDAGKESNDAEKESKDAEKESKDAVKESNDLEDNDSEKVVDEEASSTTPDEETVDETTSTTEKTTSTDNPEL